MLQVEQIYTQSPLRNFTYLIYDKEGRQVVSIDPFEASPLIRRLDELGLTLTHIINTHEHKDHTNGNIGLVNRYNAKVLAHAAAARHIPCFSEALQENKALHWKDGSLEAIDTPGHTFAHLSLLLKENGKTKAVFSGDTMFNAGVGNCHNGGQPETLYETIRDKYATLDDSVLLYPGHEYLINNLKFTLEYEPDNLVAKKLLESYQRRIQKDPKHFLITNLGMERNINTFLRLQQNGLKEMLQNYFSDLDDVSPEREFFLRLRRLRDQW